MYVCSICFYAVRLRVFRNDNDNDCDYYLDCLYKKFDAYLFALGQLTLCRCGQLRDNSREGSILGTQTIVLSL